MDRQFIPNEAFKFEPAVLRDQWLLLTAGDFPSGKFNSMTISWGSVGQIWDRLFFQVVVRPTRFTYEFMERGDTFTLCAFPKNLQKALALLGAKSGRDSDKIHESGLTPIASTLVPTPGYDEAELIAECRITYWHDIEPSHFLDPRIETHYPNHDYHRAYFGEILNVSGTEKYRA
jgi:flavin reductase (DIM6/NTAB) family NADH-FMN oxidoreductase RutF